MEAEYEKKSQHWIYKFSERFINNPSLTSENSDTCGLLITFIKVLAIKTWEL